MPILYLDFETKSKSDISTVGSHKYFEDPSTDVLCLSYLYDDGQSDREVKVWTPDMIQYAPLWRKITQPTIKLYAWSTQFEIEAWRSIMVGKYGWPELPDGIWYDVQAVAVSKGYPADLAKASKALHTAPKLSSGARLIKYFSLPRDDGEFNNPIDNPDQFRELTEYCVRDTELTHELHLMLGDLPQFERKLWLNTVKINRRGVNIDTVACRNIIKHTNVKREKLNTAIDVFTGGVVTRVTQRERIKNYISEHFGVRLRNMQGNTILNWFAAVDRMTPEEVEQYGSSVRKAKLMLKWFLNGGKSSVAKYIKMMDHVCKDRTVKGFLFYHGAGTGRYSGRGVQFQNFPNKVDPDADTTIELLDCDDSWMVEFSVGDIFDVGKKLLRSMIIAPPGKYICVADYKSIEAVGTAWTCGETEILQSFVRGEDQYRRTAAKMYSTEYALVTDEQRFAGKIAVLACGFGGGSNAILGMAEKMRMKVSEQQAIEWTGQFRAARPALTQAWKAVESTARAAMNGKEGQMYDVPGVRGMMFTTIGNDLRIVLPSGRHINYPEAKIVSRVSAVYKQRVVDLDTMETETMVVHEYNDLSAMWVDSTTHQWRERDLYGSLMFQNYIQGLCRDILAEAQLRLEENGFPICINVHDELGGLVDTNDEYTYNRFRSIMTRRPQWLADDFPVLADGYIAKRYRK